MGARMTNIKHPAYRKLTTGWRNHGREQVKWRSTGHKSRSIACPCCTSAPRGILNRLRVDEEKSSDGQHLSFTRAPGEGIVGSSA